jgi:uncharacterized phage protein (TIGR02218 family)
MGLRHTYCANCSNLLYGSQCKISPAPLKIPASIININGDKIMASAFAQFPDTTSVPNGWWVTGFIERPPNGDMRFIIGHTSTEITLLAAMEGITPGEEIYIYAGCDHSFTTCTNKFNNGINYGSFPFAPLRNPFEHKVE